MQGDRVLEDFDIRKEANGSFKALVKSYLINVENNVLDIHLLWSGKGSCCQPTQWTYGPLISAIHVYPGIFLYGINLFFVLMSKYFSLKKYVMYIMQSNS